MNDFWEWVEQTLVPGLYNNGWYNGKSGRAGFLNDKMSFVVGVARMRQLRVKSGKETKGVCVVNKELVKRYRIEPKVCESCIFDSFGFWFVLLFFFLQE